MAPMDLVINTPEAQRMALFFDYILIWGLSREQFSKEQNEQYSADLSYLREQGVVIKCGLGIPCFNASGYSFSLFEEMNTDCDLLLPSLRDTGVPKEVENETHADRVVRRLSSQLIYNDHPVVAHANPNNLSINQQEYNALEITIKNIPIPPENIPWDDLIQFRREEENVAKLRALRLWLQRRAVSKQTPREIQEELEHLLYEYQKYMELQHKKFSQGVISTLISSAPEIVADIASLNFGNAIKSLFDIKGRHIELSEAELTAPGREVSYIFKAKQFTDAQKA